MSWKGSELSAQTLRSRARGELRHERDKGTVYPKLTVAPEKFPWPVKRVRPSLLKARQGPPERG